MLGVLFDSGTIFICLSNVTDVTGHTAGLIGLLIGASFMFNAVTIQRHFYASHKIDELMQATPVMVHNQEPNLKNSMHSSLTTANDEPIAPSSISSMEPDYDLLQHKIILTIVLCALFRKFYNMIENVCVSIIKSIFQIFSQTCWASFLAQVRSLYVCRT
jgi:hypothetical protein